MPGEFDRSQQVSTGSDASRNLGRLISLDCLRGAVVASMVLVNNPGDPDFVYSQLAHLAWHGMTFADIIAPWFLWVIGVTTAISLSRRMESATCVAVFEHVVQRGIALYVIGVILMVLPLFLQGARSSVFESLKVMGVLQRIAICYVLGSALFLLVASRGRAVIAVLLLVGYWFFLVWFPGPAEGTGPFEQGGNRVYILDRELLGHHGDITSHSLFTIPAVISTILFGTLTGDLIRRRGEVLPKFTWLFSSGLVLCVVGMLISQWIPINRYLWTPSFAVLTSGMAAATFSVIYGLLEVLRLRIGAGWLIAYGANPISLLVLSDFGRIICGAAGVRDSTGGWQSAWMVGYKTFLSIADPRAASALLALTYMVALGAIAKVMYRKEWIVKM